ncbi:hypothetical protein DAPPUDRAFT_320479 [Daphnia pulex]|uniref:Chromo domain-containing protein n=1 Tax=Daphnia pulex TaxID=6669 RepID=E9GPY8_DAPPU|nr:hypothetical protein DAPPUDRAFT_320479 [Daphnia pulex]|eukprot:EFX78471.1 hypothetical protein DAPPUDRAFT_320479 [Daphnia pulex]
MDNHEEYEVEAILDMGICPKGKKWYLIKWIGFKKSNRAPVELMVTHPFTEEPEESDEDFANEVVEPPPLQNENCSPASSSHCYDQHSPPASSSHCDGQNSSPALSLHLHYSKIASTATSSLSEDIVEYLAHCRYESVYADTMATVADSPRLTTRVSEYAI